MLNKYMDDFMDAYQVERTAFDADNSRNMLSLAADEMVELEQELYNGTYHPIPTDQMSRENVVKEALDVCYVMMQRLRRMGVDLDASFAELQRSNMSKTVPLDKLADEVAIARDRYPGAVGVQISDTLGVLRDPSTGKVIKPTTYSPADIKEGVHYGIA